MSEEQACFLQSYSMLIEIKKSVENDNIFKGDIVERSVMVYW